MSVAQQVRTNKEHKGKFRASDNPERVSAASFSREPSLQLDSCGVEVRPKLDAAPPRSPHPAPPPDERHLPDKRRLNRDPTISIGSFPEPTCLRERRASDRAISVPVHTHS